MTNHQSKKSNLLSWMISKNIMKNKEPTNKRLLNIAKRMLVDGEVFYSTFSPKMSNKEYNALCALGFHVQSEWPHPPESRLYYMMEPFKDQNINLYNNLKSI